MPKELGPYAYSTINVRLDSIQKEPETVRGFVKGMVKGLKFLYANPNESAEIAKKQFPTMALEDLKATLDRSFSDQMWARTAIRKLGPPAARSCARPASSRATSSTKRSST